MKKVHFPKVNKTIEVVYAESDEQAILLAVNFLVSKGVTTVDELKFAEVHVTEVS